MKKILLASKNKGKLKEFKELFSKYGYEIISLEDLNDHDEVEENGRTFKDNALIKARYYHEKYQMDTISDDSGISIVYFNHLPGIYSARFLKHLSYPLKNELILSIMKDIKNRDAYYTCDIAMIIDGQEMVFEGILNGEIAYEQKGENGFGYDPIFYLKEYDKTTAELSSDEKNAISHRGIALRKLVAYFEK